MLAGGVSLFLVAASAPAQVVSLGQQLTTNGLGQSNTISTLTGGPYNQVTFSTNWCHNSGSATSLGVGINFNAGPFYNIIASLSSISGFNNNPNPSNVSAVCNLTMPVSSATALSMIRGQNALSGGYVAADWNNVTLTFSYLRRHFVIPSGIINLGDIDHSTGAALSIIPGGTGGFNPTVGLYSSEGYLMASNSGAANKTMEQTGVLLGKLVGDPGLNKLDLPQGIYYMFIGGAGSTFASDDLAAKVPGGAAGGSLAGSIGALRFSDTIAQGDGHWYQFNVVPAPGPVALVGLAGLVAFRRRR
jgi:hypothetical protein